MSEIKCPHCGEVFKVDEQGYAAIVAQVKTAGAGGAGGGGRP